MPTGYEVEADDEGNFTFAPLADGEYFLMVLPPDFGLPGFEPVIPLPEQVSVLTQEGVVASSALRVKINKGDAVTGFEIIVRPVVVPIALPSSGAGPTPANDTFGHIASGLAVAAALLLAGGAALRARGSRRA